MKSLGLFGSLWWALVSHIDEGRKQEELRLGGLYTRLLVIAVCNNVGEAAFLGQNQKFEKFWTAEL